MALWPVVARASLNVCLFVGSLRFPHQHQSWTRPIVRVTTQGLTLCRCEWLNGYTPKYISQQGRHLRQPGRAQSPAAPGQVE